jgi:hypothetical protein
LSILAMVLMLVVGRDLACFWSGRAFGGEFGYGFPYRARVMGARLAYWTVGHEVTGEESPDGKSRRQER